MAVIRVVKNKNYTTVSNVHLKDINLSLKAKGLLTVMLSLPDDWDYSIAGLISICKESKKAIQSTLVELEENGYLTRTRVNDSSGRFDYEYTVYEIPFKNSTPQYQKGCTVEGWTVEGWTEKELQLNTKKLNTKKLNTKELKEKDIDKSISKKKIKNIIPPKLEDVINYCNERNNGIDAQYFIDFYESKGWKVGNQKMKDWQAAIRTWERNNSKTKTKSNTQYCQPIPQEDDALKEIFGIKE